MQLAAEVVRYYLCAEDKVLREVAANVPVDRSEYDQLMAVSSRLRLELDSLRHEVQDILRSSDALTGAYGRAQLLPALREWRELAMLCHRLVVENDRIVDYKLRVPEQKQKAVAAFKLLNYHVISGGDSFNDTAMLSEAHVGLLFRAPDNVKRQFPQFQAVEAYAELMKLIRAAMA